MKRIKLTGLLNESSPGFENRQVGDVLPTLDSVRNAYQAKKALQESESFTAINKDSGEVSVFKSKDSRDSAIKAGTHNKSKAAKGGDSSAGKDTPKVNIFNKSSEEDDNIDRIKKDIDNNGGKAVEDDEDEDLEGERAKLVKQQDKLGNSKATSSNKKKMDSNNQRIKDIDGKLEKQKPETPKSASPDINREANKAIRGKAKKLGITPQKLGKEEYEKKMAQAAYEALTDSNFHTEARHLIADLEGKPELAEKPNYPSMDDKDYSTKIKAIRAKYDSEYSEPDEDSGELGRSASSETSWDGAQAIDGIIFDLKMNGSHKLADKILQSWANSQRNESVQLNLSKLLPESLINEGTRSQVGIIDGSGKIISTYVHYDGYPSNMKPGIKKHLKSPKDVVSFIKNGGASGLDANSEIKPYGKSGSTMKGTLSDIGGYIKNADRKGGAEFVYLYNSKDKKWYFADTYKDTELKKLF